MSINVIPDFSIVKATIEDAGLLTAIAFLSKKHWNYPDEWMELWREGLIISPKIIEENDSYKITSNNNTLGFIVISDQDKLAEILHSWIKPTSIGQGLGSLLISHVFKLEKFKGKVFEVTADPNAVPFYKKFGFLEFDKQPSTPTGRVLPIMRMTNG